MDQLRVPIVNETGSIISMRFQEFLQNFQRPIESEELTQQRFLNDYLLQIQNMIHCNKSTVYVDFLHLKEMDNELAEAIELEYYQFEPYLRHAVHNIVIAENPQFVYDVDKGQREFFVSFYNLPKIEHIRQVKTEKIGRLISISGTVTRTSEVRPELLYGYFLCKHCATAYPNVEQQFQYTEPIICKNPQCSTKAKSFEFVLDKSTFIDWQRLRVQENADEIPPGSMPRCLDVICRNEAVEIAKAGDKIVITGSVSVLPDTSGLARAGESTISSRSSMTSEYNDGVGGLRQLGVKEMTYKMIFVASSIQLTDQRTGKANTSNILPYYSEMNQAMNAGFVDNEETIQFSDTELKRMEEMFKTQDLYTRMAESICPTVFGHMEVKRGILLMLLGGVHKKTPEGISLRGDLNICIVGDPSCAKSQFLKYVHGFLPRTIYTSGKSSSAAGLTASVVRDAETGEFCVEAGALMLADNGICCIDEFDKMDATDQVAIHEAMEQQTISITKAGIQATLNARTSILAAANPVFGRYDRTKTLKANIAVSAAIMSRFDLFFVILDECNPKIDEFIARHIINNHKEGGLEVAAANAPFSREDLQKYIAFARTINPEFNDASRRVLVDCYRLLRQNDMLGKNKTAYRITVRQLESLVRLSEALARLHWDLVVKETYVREAYRLLQRSIIFVETEDVELEDDEVMDSREEKQSMEIASMEQDNIATSLISTRQQETKSYQAVLDSTEEPISTSDPEPTKTISKTEKKKSKQDLKISQKEYSDLAYMIALRLKILEENCEFGQFHGVIWKDLAQWVFEQYEEKLPDEDAKQQKRKVIYQVIRRMIKHEGAIVVLNTGDAVADALPNEEKALKVLYNSSYLQS